MAQGNVFITINDGGSATVSVPGSNVQVVIGCSSAGTAGVPVATKSPSTLQSSFGSGPLVEAAAMAVASGGTVIAMKAASNAAGTAEAVQFAGTGSSIITVTGAPADDYFVVFKVVSGGTIGTGPITFQLSLDAGRDFGPVLSLGTAVSYVIGASSASAPGYTGMTLHFAAGTLVTGDVAQFATIAPSWNDAGINTCLTALLASAYATTGWGSMHIVSGLGGAGASDVSTINGYLDTASAPAFATNYVYTRAYMSARDALIPTAWGGAGETEATWTASIVTAFAAVSAKRVSVGAGCYNMPSALGSGLGQGGSAVGSPEYRRQLTWAAAARQVLIPPQRLVSRVRDGSLAQIIQNPLTDPTDGFIYHDERVNPGLDYIFAGTGGRFMAACTRVPSLPGYYITDPLLSSPLGSDFNLMPRGLVMDVACDIVHQVGQEQVDDNVRVTPQGTINVNDAITLQNEFLAAINANMTAQLMISSATVLVDQTNNILATGVLNVSVTITGVGYILSEQVQIAYNNG
jgi:hypothetical protein